MFFIQSVLLATEPGISLIILPLAGGPLLRVATIRGTTPTHRDTFFFISHTTNILLFKFRCNIINAGFGSEWDVLYLLYTSYACLAKYAVPFSARFNIGRRVQRLWLIVTVLLEKLTVSQPIKKFPTFYGTRRFITAYTTARHLSLSRATSILSIHPQSPS
jgi:hypothetical protein